MARKHRMLWLRPSPALGLFFGGLVLLCILLSVWQRVAGQWLILGISAPRISGRHWNFLIICLAAFGWYATSYMAWQKPIRRFVVKSYKKIVLEFRPSRMLGLFFLLQLVMFVALAWWQKATVQPHVFLGYKWAHLTLQNWVVLAGVEAAVWGWVVTSYMTLRNSIKQHTINTLLQSRLSATYIDNANRINRVFFPPNGYPQEHVPVEYFHEEVNKDNLLSVIYLTNYFEFLSVGIRHGDLDEKVLRSTIAGIVCRFYERMYLYIKNERGDDGTTVAKPRTLEHYTWLYERWKKRKAADELLGV